MISLGRDDGYAPLRALILAGGHSSRMGRDKAHIEYHGIPHWVYLHDLCSTLGFDVYISCREEQSTDFGNNHKVYDLPGYQGPLGAIASAMLRVPDSAWLILACDLPLLEIHDLYELIDGREPTRMATSFISPFDGLPEPLIAIWEPAIQPRVLAGAATGMTCPRKVLREADIQLLTPGHPERLMNVNTFEEFQSLNKVLHGV